MKLMFNGAEYFGPRGPAGPDGSPIGTVISYMGLAAPKDYLICDGTEHAISDYPALAAFFQKQFGSANHFGGDGTASFAVPDLRNLFLRGYHGEAEEQLSGGIGEKQEATACPYFVSYNSSAYFPSSHENGPAGADALIGTAPFKAVAFDSYPGAEMPEKFTARPVNAAVLYCIKAVESIPAGNIYSTEETRVGTWIDGRPLYRKTFIGISPNAPNGEEIADISALSVGTVANGYGWIETNSNSGTIYIPYTIDVSNVCFVYISNDKNGLMMLTRGSSFIGKNFWYTVEYTKTTDQGVET